MKLPNRVNKRLYKRRPFVSTKRQLNFLAEKFLDFLNRVREAFKRIFEKLADVVAKAKAKREASLA